MVALAKNLGHSGQPFGWDDEERRRSRARLDALYFLFYDIEGDDAAYVLDTFPIVREIDMGAFDDYRTKKLVLGYMAAFASGDAGSRIDV